MLDKIKKLRMQAMKEKDKVKFFKFWRDIMIVRTDKHLMSF